MAYIRSAGIRGFRSVVAGLGCNAEEATRLAGLPDAALDSGDTMVSDAAVAIALEIAASRLNCADFGQRMAMRQDLTLLGPLVLAIQDAATIGDAMENCAKYVHVDAPPLSLTPGEDPENRPAEVPA